MSIRFDQTDAYLAEDDRYDDAVNYPTSHTSIFTIIKRWFSSKKTTDSQN